MFYYKLSWKLLVTSKHVDQPPCLSVCFKMVEYFFPVFQTLDIKKPVLSSYLHSACFLNLIILITLSWNFNSISTLDLNKASSDGLLTVEECAKVTFKIF